MRAKEMTVWNYANDEQKALMHYPQCGLDDVYLCGGYEIETIDGEEFITVKDIDGLRNAIGVALIRGKKLLSGKEIRFLRRELDLTQSEMARFLGCDAQQVARYEKGTNKMPGSADRLLRLIYKEHTCGSINVTEILRSLDQLDSRLDEKQVFEATDEGWKSAA